MAASILNSINPVYDRIAEEHFFSASVVDCVASRLEAARKKGLLTEIHGVSGLDPLLHIFDLSSARYFFEILICRTLKMYGKTDVPGTAVVTGGASGIGLATAIAFALAGCSKIALLDISDQNLQAAKAAIIDTLSSAQSPTIPIELIHCDVSSADSVAEAYATVIKLLDRIDYSVHCAGIFVRGGRSVDCSVEDFDRQNTVAYRGLWLCSRQALATMKKQTLDYEAFPDAKIPEARAQRGAIVNISSQLARGWQDGKQAYIASKAAVVALTHCDALDYVNDRIRVNCVLPGVVETPMTTATPEVRSNVEAASVARTPMKRFGRPEEIADTVVFLSGNRSSFTTGAEFVVDGGYCAQ